MSSNRRDFIKFVVAGSVAAGCPIDLALLAETAPPAVEGEHNEICHAVRDGKVFSRPQVSARHDYVIVGGGVSGLTAAYLLRDRDFLLLEKEPHFGGNAYRMDYQGDGYATGTAFIWKDDVAYPFVHEIGLTPLAINCWDGTVLKAEFIADTWRDGLDKLPYPASVREAFKKWKKEMLAIDMKTRADELFDVPFSDFFKGYPPEVKQWWDNYGPSNWGGTTEDTAAPIGIYDIQDIGGNDLVDKRYTWPGGNGAITARLTEILTDRAPDRMLAGATTIAVSSEKSEARVTYLLNGELKTVAAKAVIMATPKFITRRIVEGLPDKQADAMAQIRYIPYPLVNVIYDKQVFAKGYDTWCPDGNTFTDFIVADWVLRRNPDYKPKHNILSFYTPMREEQRGMLLTEASARHIAANVLRDFQKLLSGSNVDPLEVHIYRRGHPMYIPEAGLYKKVQPLTRVPLDRIFFANTDSEGPVSLTPQAIVAARRTVKEADEKLAKKA